MATFDTRALAREKRETRLHWRLLDGVIRHRALILAAIALLALAAGGLLHLAGEAGAGDEIWRVAVMLLAVELAFEVGHTVIVDHHLGVDTIALVAMVGSLALGEELAGVDRRLDVLGRRGTRGHGFNARAARAHSAHTARP